MATTIQHASNRSADKSPSLFRNDFNNVAALEAGRLQKKALEEAAQLQSKKLDEVTQDLKAQFEEEKKRIQQERDDLQRDKQDLCHRIDEQMKTEERTLK